MISETRKSTIGLKKVLCTVLALFMAFACLQPSFTALAADSDEINVGDLYLTYDEENASYYVSDCNYYASGEIIIPSEYNGIPVTRIGYEAFYYCESITSVTIPDSVTSIGSSAFQYCYDLTSVTIGKGVTSIGSSAFYNTAYYNNSSNWENGVLYIGNHLIKAETTLSGEYTIKNGTKTIANSAFDDCDSLTSIIIPDSVTSIGSYAFDDCDNLTSVTIGKGVTSIGSSAFEYCSNLENLYITDIGAWLNIEFGDYYANPRNYAENIYINGELAENIVIPEGVTEIPDSAFSDWDNLVSVTIPDSVTSIGSSAFYNCDGLTSITIPDSVTSIGLYAFDDCDNLTSVTIGKGVTSIGSSAFYECYSLENVYISDLGAWCNIDFDYYGYNGELYYTCNPMFYAENLYINSEKPVNIVIPDGATKIPYKTFYNNDNLVSVSIPDSITDIEEYAFYDCDSLMSVTIPDNVTTIANDAFGSCDSLVSVEIGDGVTEIGSNAFENCKSLISASIGNGVKTIGSYAFYNCTSLNSLSLGNSVETIGYEAFDSCTSLKTVIIPDSVKTIGDYAFDDCSSLATVTIGKGVTAIGEYAFGDCDSLESITIPGSVTTIGEGAFYSSGLKSITIPAGVTTIGDYAFGDCYYMTAINVDANNASYSSADGVLYNKAKTTLIKYPENKEAKSFKIPDTVVAIASNGFTDTDVETLTLGNGMSNIMSYAFSSNYNLEKLVIPTKVTSISSGAFSDCYYIEEVFYAGTQSQWNNVAIASNNGDLSSARVHYNVDISNLKAHYGEPTKTVEPSCYEVGIHTYVCACGFEFTEIFADALEHDYSEQWIVDWEPSCYDGGRESRHCSHCGSTTDHRYTEPLGHDYSEEWTIDYEPTCIHNGSKSRHCSRCDSRIDAISIPADSTKHNYSGWITEKLPTCSAHGKRFKICNTCGGVVYEVIPTTDHKAGDWITDKKATANAAGSKHKECTVCGETIETAKIAQLKCSKPSLKKIENTADGVKITWGKVTGADSYAIYRKTGSGKYTKIATVKGNSKVTYTDKKAKSGKNYSYYVKAINEAGSSSASGAKSILYLADTTLSTPKSTKNGITLKWKKVTGAEGYQVWRKTGSGSYKKIATVKGNSKVTYTDKKAQKGKTYTYKIKAYKGNTTSAYSNTKKIKDKY